jgi:hypothetical protein
MRSSESSLLYNTSKDIFKHLKKHKSINIKNIHTSRRSYDTLVVLESVGLISRNKNGDISLIKQQKTAATQTENIMPPLLSEFSLEEQYKLQYPELSQQYSPIVLPLLLPKLSLELPPPLSFDYSHIQFDDSIIDEHFSDFF